MSYTGKELIAWGFEPGAWFGEALKRASLMNEAGHSEAEIRQMVNNMAPENIPKIPMRKEALGFRSYLPIPETDIEQQNADLVHYAMAEISRVPTVQAVTVMPDACPAGTIPVGGVAATKGAIHPGYHSADVCCSMAITVLRDECDPKTLLDKVQELTHFGPTKRENHPIELGDHFVRDFHKNPFLIGLEGVAKTHFLTQGDGNHFYYVGRLESTGQLAIVSHHGSRGLGAQVYKRGLAYAQRKTRAIAPEVPKAHAWIDVETAEGEQYWEALQTVRNWTKLNHFTVHGLVAEQLNLQMEDRYWNPHNFVFERDGLFYHAKGATPSYEDHSFDDSGRCIIPMNMSEPILITQHTDQADALGFAPHGAGRNMSRTQFLRENDPEPPADIDYRFWCGIPDKSELPQAYKPAAGVITAIKEHQLADIVDRVMPYGSIMAGDWEVNAPWRKKKEKTNGA